MENLTFLSWNDLYVGRYVGDDREQTGVIPLPTRAIVIRGHDTQGHTDISVSVDRQSYYQGQVNQDSAVDSRGTDLVRIEVPIMIHGDVEIEITVNSGGFVWTGVDTNYAGHAYEIIINPDAHWESEVDQGVVLLERKSLSYDEFDSKYGKGAYTNNFLYAIKSNTENVLTPIVQPNPQQDPKQNFKINGVPVLAENSGEVPHLIGAGQIASCHVRVPPPVLCWSWPNLP